MPLEYLTYLILPFLDGLCSEKYKGTDARKYAIFIFFVLVFMWIYTILTSKS